MFGNNYYDGLVSISSGRPNGRNIHDNLMDGHVTISGTGPQGNRVERTVTFHAGEVQAARLKIDGKTVHHIVYGKFEKKGDREIIRFHKTGKSKHGKARRVEKLFDQDGVCHSWYKNGALVRQNFIYDTRRKAYEYRIGSQAFMVKDHTGKPLYEVKGRLAGGIQNCLQGSHSVFGSAMEDWFNRNHPFEVRKAGKVFYGGQIVNNQRIGKWVVKGKAYFYEHGVEIPQRLYDTPPEKLNPAEILKLTNAQVRMALMAKIGPERIAEAGTEIDRDGSMILYDIKGYDVRILRVQCPTTKSYYFLRVPKDSMKCEPARQWTFHVGDMVSKPIKFKIET